MKYVKIAVGGVVLMCVGCGFAVERETHVVGGSDVYQVGEENKWMDTVPDPRDVDRGDPEAVLRAFVITSATWDTKTDKSSAYALRRAAVYLTQEKFKELVKYNPDTAKGQAEFIEAEKKKAYATVEIRGIFKEGLAPDQSNEMRRVVHYLVKVTPRDGVSPTKITAWDAWVTMTQEGGRWAIVDMRTQPTRL